ncbi:hypothetical protein [Rathayibacter tanaceti]|nr:hypothetical protein [Rathayibacter tanaceti]
MTSPRALVQTVPSGAVRVVRVDSTAAVRMRRMLVGGNPFASVRGCSCPVSL